MFVAAGCGGPTKDPESRTAAEFVIERGGRLQLAGQTELINRAEQIPDKAFAIQRIDFNETRIGDDDLQGLPALKALQSLGLYRTEVTDSGLTHLSRYHNLTELELSYTAITDEGLSALEKLPQLQRLFLYGTRVTAAGVDHVRKAKSGVSVYHDPFTAPSDSAAAGQSTAAGGSRPTGTTRPSFR